MEDMDKLRYDWTVMMASALLKLWSCPVSIPCRVSGNPRSRIRDIIKTSMALSVLHNL
jgi:hypothetical protein